MLFKRKFVLYPVLLSSVFLLTGCPLDDDEETAHVDPSCIGSAKEVTTSDARTLCITLTAFKADAPFMAGFNAPGKTTHTVFVSDSEGNPVNVSNDDVLTGVSQYPYMTMDSGHKHSAPYREADLSAAEYGAYNLDVYYPMPSAMMDGTSMGTWEYRVKISDNNGTADDDTDDVTHTVSFEPVVQMIMSSKAFRAVGKNESDKYKSAMDVVADRQYFNWLESVGKVVDGAADVKLYITTQDMDHADMAMDDTQTDGHDHDHADMDSMGTDSQTYPPVHAPMDMMGSTMTLTLHDAVDNAAVEVATVSVEVSADDGATWTTLAMSGMEHDDFGYYNASVPMTAGDVTLLVKTTVNGNVMTKTGAAADGTDAADMPALKFAAAE